MMDQWVNIYGLIFNCPLQIEDKNCPFWHIRQKGLRDRIKSLKEMTENQKIELNKEHQACFEKKVNALV